jgi:hypothetical protein
MAVWALFVYLGREQMGIAGLGIATLRTLGVAALLLLLLNPVQARRAPGGAPVVLLDESLSMGVPGGRWREAVDTALAIAGSEGTVHRFGSTVVAFDTTLPTAGSSLLREAILGGRALGGQLHVVTDGEIEDMGAIPQSLFDDVSFVVLPRDTLANVALLDVRVRDRVQQEDSLDLTLIVGTWGEGLPDSTSLEILQGDAVLAALQVELPLSPGVGRRRLQLEPGLLSEGAHVIHLRLVTSGDSVSGDDRRTRVVTVSQQPDIVVVVDPADWEGRFLVSELRAVAQASVRGYARVQDETWFNMNSLVTVGEQVVRDAARGDAMLVVRGGSSLGADILTEDLPVWMWPAGGDAATDFLIGDWYVVGNVPASPLAGELGLVSWETLPPLTGIRPVSPDGYDWIGLAGRLARRGVERPALVGRETATSRQLTTNGSGLWRWAFRGGSAREAYRALLSSGTDWLLQSTARPSQPALTAGPVVSYGEAVRFRWMRDSVPDSTSITVRSLGTAATESATLWFDEGGNAVHSLSPGVYRWNAPAAGARGLIAVEEYSEEIHPRTVRVFTNGGSTGVTLVERYARERWWLFALVVLALAAEWGWRHRKGLP